MGFAHTESGNIGSGGSPAEDHWKMLAKLGNALYNGFDFSSDRPVVFLITRSVFSRCAGALISPDELDRWTKMQICSMWLWVERAEDFNFVEQ